MSRIEITGRVETKTSPSVWPTVVGLGMCLAAVPAYMLLLDTPMFRSTGLPAWLLLIAGTALGVRSARGDHRAWVRAIGFLNPALLGFFVLGFFWFTALPAPAEAAYSLTTAPSFELRDHRNRTVSLTDELAKGPVLLAFYRGHW